jgi:hypothetical protein
MDKHNRKRSTSRIQQEMVYSFSAENNSVISSIGDFLHRKWFSDFPHRN